MTPPASMDNVKLDTIRPQENMSQANGPTMDQEQENEVVRLAADDRTPKLENPPSVQAVMSEDVQHKPKSQLQGDSNIDGLTSGSADYFTVKILPETNVTDFVQSTVSASGPSRLDNSPGIRYRNTSPSCVCPDSRTSSWKDFSTQRVIGPSYNPGSTRPTSVPNFQAKSLSRRREGPDYPTYPDQSFQALQNQQYPTPYHPGSPRPLRTRSSHPPQNIPFTSTDGNNVSGMPQPSSGAKTVGNTPAQSPGLFSPIFPVRKPWAVESDDGRSSTPMLHPSHHKEPKE